MNNEPYIGVAWGSPGGAMAEFSNSIEEIVGKRPQPIRLMDLAGPNETIQILLEAEHWILLAKAVGLLYGAEIVKEAGKSSWNALVPKIDAMTDSATSSFMRLVSAAKNALHGNAPVVFGLNYTPKSARRHIGIEIMEGTPEEIGRVISILAENADLIQLKLQEWDEKVVADRASIIYEENSDCSVKLIITDDGSILLKAAFLDQHFNKEEITYEILKKQ